MSRVESATAQPSACLLPATDAPTRQGLNAERSQLLNERPGLGLPISLLLCGVAGIGLGVDLGNRGVQRPVQAFGAAPNFTALGNLVVY